MSAAAHGPILVLGGSGFIGAHLVRALAEAGCAVRVLDRSAPKYAPFPASVQATQADWQDDSALAGALHGVHTVIHLIWNSVPGSSANNPRQDFAENVLGSLRLLDACVAAKVRRVIFSSTGGAVYGTPQQLPIPETHPTEPWSPYGIAKLAVEKYLAFYQRVHGLDYVIARAANAYGPYQRPGTGQGVIATFIKRLHQGEPLEIWGSTRIVRDYIYVTDLVDALFRLARQERPAHAIYNVGSGTGTSLDALLAQLAALHNRVIEKRVLPPRGFDPPANVLDNTRIQTDTGWQPQISLAQGLQQTWDWLVNHNTP